MNEHTRRCIRCKETFFREVSSAKEKDENGYWKAVNYKTCPECRPKPKAEVLELTDYFALPYHRRLQGI